MSNSSRTRLPTDSFYLSPQKNEIWKPVNRKSSDDAVLMTYLLGSQEIKGLNVSDPSHIADHLSEDVSVDAMITLARVMVGKLQSGQLTSGQVAQWLDDLAYQRSGFVQKEDICPSLMNEVHSMAVNKSQKPNLAFVA